jgi:hypothetical protein
MSKTAAQTEISRLNDKPADTLITARYHDGEYLSAYQVTGTGAEMLEALGLAKYISGWGYRVATSTIKALGTTISYNAAVEYTRPARETAANQKAREQAARDEKFAQAVRTGAKVLLYSYMDDCDDPREECSQDSVNVYAMPTGSTKEFRSHTY